MTLNRLIKSISRPASGDLSTNQYRLVGVDSAGRVVTIGNSSTPFLGVLMNKPSAVDQAAEIAANGSIVKVEAGATIAEGDLITAVAGGRGSPTTTDAHFTVGYALTPGGSGTFCEVAVNPGQRAS